MNLYSLFDKKLGEIGAIVQAKNLEMIGRALRSLMLSDNEVAKFPEDYDLVLLGTVDVESGVITPVVPIVIVYNMASGRGDENA